MNIKRFLRKYWGVALTLALVGLGAMLLYSERGYAQGGVSDQGLPARYIAAFTGAGVVTDALLGPYCKSAATSGSTLTLVCQDTEANGNAEITTTFTDTGLTPAQARNLELAFIGGEISGTTLTFTHADGSVRNIDLPAAGGTGTADGVVVSAAVDAVANVVTLTTSTNATVTFDLSALLIIRVDSVTGLLPDAATNPGRIALSGNYLYHSIDHGGHDKVVTFAEYSRHRTGTPAPGAQELLYYGSFPSPPHSNIGNYPANAIAWDRGSQVWIIKPSSTATRWSTYSGPLGWHHGSVYTTRAQAADHVPTASDLGQVVIYGTGNMQRPYIVTAFTAATTESWQWDPVGATHGDIIQAITEHNSDDTAVTGQSTHLGLRSLILAATATGRPDAFVDVRWTAATGTLAFVRADGSLVQFSTSSDYPLPTSYTLYMGVNTTSYTMVASDFTISNTGAPGGVNLSTVIPDGASAETGYYWAVALPASLTLTSLPWNLFGSTDACTGSVDCVNGTDITINGEPYKYYSSSGGAYNLFIITFTGITWAE